MSKIKGLIGKYIYKICYGLVALLIPDDYRICGWPKEQYLAIQEYLSKKINFEKDDIVLDFGCGSGIRDRLFASKVKKIIGCDHLFSMVRRARRNTANFPNAQIIHHKSNKLPFEDNIFSKVFSCSVFQYFPDFEYAKQIMEEMFRITKRGGKVFIFDLIDRNKMVFPKYGSRDIFHPITYFQKILQYYFACAYSSDEILEYCKSKGMIPSILKDDRVFVTNRDCFSCWIKIVK